MVGTILICLLAIYGTVELLLRFSRWLWMPKRLRFVTVVPLSEEIIQPEQTVHRTTEEMLRDRSGGPVFFVDMGLSEERCALHERLARTGEYAEVISWENLHEKLHFMQE